MPNETVLLRMAYDALWAYKAWVTDAYYETWACCDCDGTHRDGCPSPQMQAVLEAIEQELLRLGELPHARSSQ